MIRLTSKWTLKHGLTPELLQNIESAAELIQTKESGTLMYLVHLDESLSLEHSHGLTSEDAKGKEIAITFIEIYKNSTDQNQVNSKHNKGQVFAEFRKNNLKFFEEDPENPGWPAFDSQMLKLDSGLVQQQPRCTVAELHALRP